MCVNSKELSFVAAEGGFDTVNFAAVLEDFIEVEMLNELMQSEFGQGILTGIYMSHIGNTATEQEVARLEAEESYD